MMVIKSYKNERGISSYTARFGDTYTSFLALKAQKRLLKHKPYHAYMLIYLYVYIIIMYKLCI